MTKNGKRAKITVSAQYLIETMQELGITTNVAMGEALGVHASAISTWRTKKEMPKLARVACEGLRRRHKKMGSANHIVIARLPGDKVKAVEQIIAAMGGSLKAIDMEAWDG